MFKYDHSENSKTSKKQKEVKLLTNYIPIKKANAHSHISEYETESSIQKNFSNKCQKNKNHIQAKSVRTTHNNFIPNKVLEINKNEKLNQRNNKSSRGSLYNLNNLNLGDYFSEKVIVTQQKFIDYKENKINTLQRELSLLKKELNLYEVKNNVNVINSSKNKKITGNNTRRNKSHSTDKNMNNLNNNLKDIIPKNYNENSNNNKILLGNNKSYISFSTFYSNEILNNKSEIADKKLKKHLSSLLTETNVTNVNIKNNATYIINNNNIKHKNKNKKNKKNAAKDMNKKNLLNMIYLSKKGCYNHANNNYDHNTKIANVNMNINNTCTANNINKGKIGENEIKHDLHFYANTMKERQMIIKENLLNKKGNKGDIRMRNDLQNLNDKINNLFNCFFDYYEKNKDKMK
jgi:hypothetical protein